MDALELAFEEFGDPGSNYSPLIILHGFLASSRNWRHVAQKLAGNFHIYVVDMRNHGDSQHSPVMDYQLMANDLILFLNQHVGKKASLLGHSMGGKVAMWLALNNPDYLDNLIVADIAPKSYQHSFRTIIDALQSIPLSNLKNRKMAETLLTPAIPELSYRQFLLQNLILKDGDYCWRIDLEIFSQTASNIAAFPDTTSLAPYRGKSLFLAGGDSNFVSIEDIIELFPNTLFKVIANAGHWLHVQQPAEFIKEVENFLIYN